MPGQAFPQGFPRNAVVEEAFCIGQVIGAVARSAIRQGRQDGGTEANQVQRRPKQQGREAAAYGPAHFMAGKQGAF